LQGADGYLNLLRTPSWKFTKDQWEPEVWGKVVKKVGEDGIIYCSLEIEKENYCVIPGVCGLDFMKGKRVKPSLEKAQEMVQKAVLFAVSRYRQKKSSRPWPSSRRPYASLPSKIKKHIFSRAGLWPAVPGRQP
jgi:hypothetical protein